LQNAAVRLIFTRRRFDHITDALVTLHWLRIPERVVYKIAVLTFRVLHRIAPNYFGSVVRVADLPGRRALRSAGANRLVVPPFKLSTIGSRAFPVAGPQVWNILPEDVTSAPSLSTFPPETEDLPIQTIFSTSRPLNCVLYELFSGPSSDFYYLGHSKNCKLN